MMPSKSFAIGSIIFGIVWGMFFYPPGPRHSKPPTVVQQVAQAH